MPEYSKKIFTDAYNSAKCFLIINWKKLMISVGIFIFVGIVAFFFLQEKSWFIEHFKEGYIYGFCLLIGFPLVWIYYFLYGSPKKIWEEDQLTIKALNLKIADLTKELNNRESKDKLVLELRGIWNEGYSEDVFYRLLATMRRDKLIPESLIDDFVNYPAHKDFLTHYNETLRKIIDHLKW